GPQPFAGPGDLLHRVGRVPGHARLQGRALRTRGRRCRPLVSVVQDLLGVWAPARRAEPRDTLLGVPRLRHSARPGCQRRQEHPGRRAGGVCLRRRRKTGRGNPDATASETGNLTREERNPRLSGRGGSQGIRSYAGIVRNSAKLSASATAVNSPTAWPYRSASKPSPVIARILDSSSSMSRSTRSRFTTTPSSRATSLWIHCHTWEREISAVAASSIRLKMATAPL